MLSAYLQYFLPWNIYRLSRLFNSLPLELKANDAVNDLGAGPLTMAASLWISRPELRNIPLEFRCLDRTAPVMDAGKKFFAALADDLPGKANSGQPSCLWSVRTIRGELKRNGALSAEIRGKPAALSAAINVYNELFWNFSPQDSDGLGRFAGDQTRLLSSLTESSGSILVVEPGIPRSGEFISLLRKSFMTQNRGSLSPCTHQGSCPLPGSRLKGGGKAKWCHFTFDTEDAPYELHKLSAASRLPKERAALSFILAGPASGEIKTFNAGTASNGPVKIRIISDAFPIGKLWGRYGCSEAGLVLVSGSRENLGSSFSGAFEELPLAPDHRDAKSGASVATM
jgi:hypothetical protein